MPEWSNGTVSKTVVLVTVPGVRIPLSPRNNFIIVIIYCREKALPFLYFYLYLFSTFVYTSSLLLFMPIHFFL